MTGVKHLLKLAKLSDDDNVEAYLTTFEHIVVAAYEVKKAIWKWI